MEEKPEQEPETAKDAGIEVRAVEPSTGQPGACVGLLERPVGRPSTYTKEAADRFLEVYANQRYGTVLDACAEAGTAWSTIRGWRADRDDFRQAFARARADKAEIVAGEAGVVLDAVDTDSPFGSARVGKAREQSGYRRWLAGCLDRDTYGERPPVVAVQVNSTVVTAFGGMAGKVQGEE